MTIHPTPLAVLCAIRHAAFGAARGRFTRLFCEQELAAIRPGLHFTQINLSQTHGRGTLRGMHYQLPPTAEAKLVHCLRGRVFDVAVDIRRGSPHFGRWVGVELSADNRRQLWIPEGFAHGFLALQDDTHFLYKTTDVYARDCERSIRWDDPAIGIGWPLPPGLKAPLVAPKDAAAPVLDAADLS